MPDLDTGHLFLNFLVPIREGAPANSPTSYEQNVRIELAKLPPPHQSPATINAQYNSPFSRNLRTHLARMFVLNDVVYNGRNWMNPLIDVARGIDTVNPNPMDQLNCSYLVFAADIDAIEKDGDPLPKTLSPEAQKKVRLAYAALLWETMEAELQAIFCNCVAFSDNVTDDKSFGRYLDRCHIETTMPFHDYYLKLPKFNNLPVAPLAAAIAIPALFTLTALAARIFGHFTLLGHNTLALTALGAVITAVAAFGAYRFVIVNGNKPLAPGEYDDLPSVLKGLYVQQAFADFTIEAQGKSATDLHDAFGVFLKTHAPSNRDAPTQPPAVTCSLRNLGERGAVS